MFTKFFKKLPTVIAVLLAATVFVARPAAAQGAADPVIVLDNATPSVDIVVTPNNGASGVVYVEMAGVHLSLKDSTNADVLTLADQRVSALAIQLAQGAATHTLHLERLPGVDQARARVTAQAALPIVDSAPSGNKAEDKLTSFAAPTITRISLAPAQSMPVTTTDKADLVSLQLPSQEATVQLVDSAGGVLLTSIAGKEISGLSLRLAPGQYALNLANRDVNSASDVTMTLSPSPVSTLPDAPANPTAGQSRQPGQVKPANLGVACTATVNVASMNLRSGPGTGYTILGSVNQSNTLAVGGVNKEGGWLLVKGPSGSAWIAQSSASLAGNCNSLPAFNIPVRNAVAPVVVQQSGNSGGQQPGISGGQQGDDHHEDQKGEDHGGDEGGGHDD